MLVRAAVPRAPRAILTLVPVQVRAELVQLVVTPSARQLVMPFLRATINLTLAAIAMTSVQLATTAQGAPRLLLHAVLVQLDLLQWPPVLLAHTLFLAVARLARQGTTPLPAPHLASNAPQARTPTDPVGLLPASVAAAVTTLLLDLPYRL